MQRKLNLSQHELILAIESCGSIGKAARQLNLTQSGVTSTAFVQTTLPDAQHAVDAAETEFRQTTSRFSIAAMEKTTPKLEILLYQGNHLEVSDSVKQE